MVYDLTDSHVFVSLIGEQNGDMYYSITCPCGCFAFEKTPVNYGDTVKVFKRIHLIGKLKDLTIIALEISIKDCDLSNCVIEAPKEVKEYYCGTRIV